MTDRERYDLELAHQKAQAQDKQHRLEIRADVEARWPTTQALIDNLFEQRMYAAL